MTQNLLISWYNSRYFDSNLQDTNANPCLCCGLMSSLCLSQQATRACNTLHPFVGWKANPPDSTPCHLVLVISQLCCWITLYPMMMINAGSKTGRSNLSENMPCLPAETTLLVVYHNHALSPLLLLLSSLTSSHPSPLSLSFLSHPSSTASTSLLPNHHPS